MIEWIKKHKVMSLGLLLISFVFVTIIMPLVINRIYYLDITCNFFRTRYGISDMLNYYGDILTFIGTGTLGIVTICQNYKFQEKTEEVNKLTLELQKKSMAMAERNYKEEQWIETKKQIPKFELKNIGMNGNYMNLTAELKNVSDSMIYGIKSIDFKVYNESDIIVIISDEVKIESTSLSSGQTTKIKFNNKEIMSSNSRQNNSQSLKNCYIMWSFQCDSSLGVMHYYRAKFNIKDSKDYDNKPWKVTKIG